MSWIRIRICISPYGSGSDFYYTNPDPQIRIRITGFETVINPLFDFSPKSSSVYPPWKSVAELFHFLVDSGSGLFNIPSAPAQTPSPKYFRHYPQNLYWSLQKFIIRKVRFWLQTKKNLTRAASSPQHCFKCLTLFSHHSFYPPHPPCFFAHCDSLILSLYLCILVCLCPSPPRNSC